MGQSCTRQWDEEKFRNAFGSKNLFMDESRERFLKYHTGILKSMVNSDFTKSNRFRQLLLGRKGIGKTELMKAIGAAATEASANIIYVYINYSSPSVAKPLFTFIEDALPMNVRWEYFLLKHAKFADNPCYRYEWLNEALFICNKVLFVVVDEFDLVYGDCQNGKYIIDEIHSIGGLDGRAIHVILSGSSRNVRKLAFCKLEEEEVPKYPNYRSTLDLNSTRYIPFQILPFAESLNVFKESTSHLMKMVGKNKDMTDDELLDLLKSSGGCVGSMLTIIQGLHPKPYSTPSKGLAFLSKEQSNMLKHLFLALDVIKKDDTSKLEKEFAKIKPIPSKFLSGSSSDFLNLSMIYELVDRGFIHFYENEEKISFSLPLYYGEFDALSNSGNSLKLSDISTLKHHAKDGFACEPIVLRF